MELNFWIQPKRLNCIDIRKIIAIISLFFFCLIGKGQDTIPVWDFGFAGEIGSHLKSKTNGIPQQYGMDILLGENNSYGFGGGAKLILEYRRKWGVNLRMGGWGSQFNDKTFDKKMGEGLGDEYLGITHFSLYTSYTTSHGLNYFELGGSVYRVFRSEKKMNFLTDLGMIFFSSRNPEYCYSVRTPSTNYYEIIQVTNKRSGFHPMINAGISIRKDMNYSVEGKEEEYPGFFTLRLGANYGFAYDDYYLIKVENHLDEITESRFDFQMKNTLYFNLSLSVTFM